VIEKGIARFSAGVACDGIAKGRNVGSFDFALLRFAHGAPPEMAGLGGCLSTSATRVV